MTERLCVMMYIYMHDGCALLEVKSTPANQSLRCMQVNTNAEMNLAGFRCGISEKNKIISERKLMRENLIIGPWF